MFFVYSFPISPLLSSVRSVKIPTRFTSCVLPSIEECTRTVRMCWVLRSSAGSFPAVVSLGIILEGRKREKDGLEFKQSKEFLEDRN